ncbi:hypothetical protein [Streptomyces sp. N50]|uniref:hypothetical protein n=1 Tax=Streptomyces sp. N50 TaxID=3081765 RepID=UPI002961E8F8|nr:hypothetical protein [Streptomyces sp. N50]WOX08068.1 hypothetical protein R2B38_03905 [Streptomyces sp. N50]
MHAYGLPPAYAQAVLRITDARTGEPVEAAPARRGLTRVEAHASGLDPTSLRVLLVSDLLVRALELGGTPVWSLLTGEHEQAELRAAARALGIRPFEDGGDLGSGLGEAQVLHVATEGGAEATGGVLVAVAPVESPTTAAPDLSDPGALRLALLSHARDLPVRLDTEALEEARRTLAHWRGSVADWARRPSRPVPDEVRGELRTAWEDDLDVPEVLEVLRRVETWPDLSDGARFETYAYADRLLGLELTRDIGSLA